MLQGTAANHGRGCLWMIYRKVKTQAGYDRCGSHERSGQMWLMSGSASVAFIIAHAGASGDPIRPQYLSARVSSYARGRPKVQAKHHGIKTARFEGGAFCKQINS